MCLNMSQLIAREKLFHPRNTFFPRSPTTSSPHQSCRYLKSKANIGQVPVQRKSMHITSKLIRHRPIPEAQKSWAMKDQYISPIAPWCPIPCVRRSGVICPDLIVIFSQRRTSHALACPPYLVLLFPKNPSLRSTYNVGHRTITRQRTLLHRYCSILLRLYLIDFVLPSR